MLLEHIYFWTVCFLQSSEIQQVEFGYQVNMYILEVKIVFIYFYKPTFKLANCVAENVFANCIHTEIPTVSVIVS